MGQRFGNRGLPINDALLQHCFQFECSGLSFAATHVSPCWLPALVGGGIGLGFSLLNRFGVRHYWREADRPLNVVITGSTRGIGKAVARVFLRQASRKCDFFLVLLDLQHWGYTSILHLRRN